MPISVFLADDHAVFRDGLRFLLEAEGDFQVAGEAADGQETVRQVSSLRPEVVVMDLAMPGLNGIEATQQIRQAGLDTQVVILSAHSSNEYIFRALQAGALGYLLKESAGREVVNALRVVHAGGRYLSRKIAEAALDDYMAWSQEAPAKSPLERLSPREREVLQLVAEGKSSKQIAHRLHLSPNSVDTYRWRTMRKLNLPDLASVVKFALQHGLTALE